MDYKKWHEERIGLIINEFKGYRSGMVLALDTPLYNTKPFGDEVEYFTPLKSYDNTPIIWVNPVAKEENTIQVQQLYIPFNGESLDALKAARRTLSLLCYMSHGVPIREIHAASGNLPGMPNAGDKLRFPSLNGFNFEILFQTVNFEAFTEDCWISLAYYRLGCNAQSEYYEFISFLQVIESSFNNDAKRVIEWVDSQTELPELADWMKSLPPNRKISGRLRSETRALCAHVANTDDGSPSVITDPDDMDSVRQVQEDLAAIRTLAKERLKSYEAIRNL